MKQGNGLLFDLLRCGICGGSLDKDITEEALSDITETAYSHDLAHLLVVGMKNSKLAISSELSNEMLKAVYGYEQLNYEYEKLCNALKAAEIDFMPLKGAVMRKFYREPWMRTSCDIDILVREGDLEKATAYLMENLGYTYEKKGRHDISLFSKNRLHVELHYTLISEDVAKDARKILKNVWDIAVKTEGHRCEMPDEMFYFYHIAHMAKHLEQGGCGIRPFIDLWILDNMVGVDCTKRESLLKQGDLLLFAKTARNLCRVWFENEKHSEITSNLEQYILRGGVYGVFENRVAIQQQKQGGRLKYALSKIFIPYDVIKLHYPVLQKHRWLTPAMEVRRWFKLVFCGHLKRTVKELEANSSISSAQAKNIQKFLKNIGL